MRRSKFIAVCVVLVMMLCGTAWSAELTDKFSISGDFSKGYADGSRYESYVTLSGIVSGEPVFYVPSGYVPSGDTWYKVSGDLPESLTISKNSSYYNDRYKIKLSGSPTSADVGTHEFKLIVACGNLYTSRDMSVTIASKDLYLTGSLTYTLDMGKWYDDDSEMERRVSVYEASSTYDYETSKYVWTYSLASYDVTVDSTIYVHNASDDYTFSVSGELPPGMYVRRGTRYDYTYSRYMPILWLEGTPVQAGDYSFTLKVSDEKTTAEMSNTVKITVPEGYVNPTDSGGSMGIAGDIDTEIGLNREYNSSVEVNGNTGDCTWSVASGTLPPGLYMEPSYRDLYLRGTPSSAGTYPFTLRVVDDSTNKYAERSFTIKVNGTPYETADMTIATNNLATEWKVNEEYSSYVTVKGYTGTIYVEVVSGDLPHGLSWGSPYSDYDGGMSVTLSGTPTTEGTYPFTLRVTDSRNAYIERKLSIKINGSTPFAASGDMTVTGKFTAEWETNEEYDSSGNVSVSGYTGTPRVSVVKGNLPSGLSLSSSGGSISLSGVPNSADVYRFTLRVTDSRNAYVDSSFTITINDSSEPQESLGGMSFEGEFEAVGRVNLLQERYSSSVHVSGYVGRLRITVVSGELPPGLSLSTSSYYRSNVTLSGILNTLDEYTFTLRATDSRNYYVEQEFTIRTEGVPALNPTPASDMTLSGTFPDGYTSDTWYENSIGLSGSTSDYTFSITDGELPPGFHIRASSYYSDQRLYLEGIPNKAGTYPFTLRVTKSNNTYVEREFTVKINEGEHTKDASMSITGSLEDTDTTKTWYSDSVQVNGGTSPYTFNVTSGDLPYGFSIRQVSSQFYLEGIPTKPGDYAFTLQVTDKRNFYVERELTMNISGDEIYTPAPADPVEITTITLPPVITGVSYSADIEVEGIATLWSITSGFLPAGISMDQTTGRISGTAVDSAVTHNASSPQGYTFTVRVSNNTGGFDEKSFTVSVSEPLKFTVDTNLPPATANNDYEKSISVDGTSLGEGIRWEVQGLPAGMYYSTRNWYNDEYRIGRTCYISGTPTSPDTYIIKAHVTNDQTEDYCEFTLVVVEPVEITTRYLDNAERGQLYSMDLEATGMVASWDVIDGTLPPGLSLDVATGLISGMVSDDAIASNAGEPVSYMFRVRASNAYGGSSSQRFTISVSEPVQFVADSALENAMVSERYTATLSVNGTFINNGFSWEVTGLPAGLSYSDAIRECTISGTPTIAGTYPVRFIVSNGRTSVDKTFTLEVEPRPGSVQKPKITLPKNYGTAYVGSPYSVKPSATGATPMTWAISGNYPAGLTLNQQTGEISGTVQAASDDKEARTPQSHNFRITATNKGGTDSADMSITVWCPPAIVTSPDLDDATKEKGYKAEIKAEGTAYGMVWKMTGGKLPDGLTLATSKNRRICTIIGTPTETGQFTVELEVANPTAFPNATPAKKTFTFNVNEDTGDNTGAPVIADDFTLPDGETGAEYAAFLEASGAKPITWSKSGSLPKGLTLNENGSITGIPEKAKTYSFTVTAKNSVGSTKKKVSIKITGEKYSKPKIKTSKIPGAVQNQPYEAQLKYTGTGPIVWSFEGSKYPAGLSITDDGIITGTPKEAGKFTIKVKAENIVGSATKSYSIKVEGIKPNITNEDKELPSATLRTRYEVQLAADGSDPITWSKSGGSLPNGLKIGKKTGIISGTPKKEGEFTFTIKAKNKFGNVTKQFTITVKAAETASDNAPEAPEAITENPALDENVAVDQPVADTPEAVEDYSQPETDMNGAEIDLCVVSGDEELRGEIYAPEGQPLTFRIGGEWPEGFEDAEVYIADEAVALEISEDGTFVLPGELVYDEFVIYVMAGNTKTIELYIVAESEEQQ